MPRAAKTNSDPIINAGYRSPDRRNRQRVRVDDSMNMTRIDMTRCATMSLGESALVLGIHRSTAWNLYQRGEFPVPVLRIGGSLRVVRRNLETYLATGVPVRLGAA
jgi:predicted DNA-binding transcriptional regulator AlpA